MTSATNNHPVNASRYMAAARDNPDFAGLRHVRGIGA